MSKFETLKAGYMNGLVYNDGSKDCKLQSMIGDLTIGYDSNLDSWSSIRTSTCSTFTNPNTSTQQKAKFTNLNKWK